MRLRAIAVTLVAALLAALVLRVAFVEALLPRDPVRAARIWPSHPSVIMASGLFDLGKAAAEGRPIPQPVIDRIISAAGSAPLSPEPFLVRGVDATLGGKLDVAGRSFIAARNRDPRSVPARYFLADHYLKAGQARQGLAEISTLTRLVPGSSAGVGPYLAAYARDPRGANEVRLMLRRNPELEPAVLQALAADASNARLAMSLWNGRSGNSILPWQQRLLESMIAAGQFGEAHGAWLRFAGQSAASIEAERGFAAVGNGPFSWTLASGPSGVVEATASGAASVIYYGRDDLVLASRLYVLPPGRHRITMRIAGISGAADALAWIVQCLPSGVEAARFQLSRAAPGQETGLSFDVPDRQCGAQRIELAGKSPELPEKAGLTVTSFRIESEGKR